MIPDISIRGVDVEFYWPDFIREYKEMQAIAEALNATIQGLLETYESLHKDLHVYTAGEVGLRRYEETLGILVPDDATIEDRRVAILAKLNTRLPYTKRVLKQYLDVLVGADGYIWQINYGERSLWIRLELKRKNQLNAVADLLRKVLPANMILDLGLRYNQVYMLYPFKVEELRAMRVQQVKEDPYIKEEFLRRGGKMR